MVGHIAQLCMLIEVLIRTLRSVGGGACNTTRLGWWLVTWCTGSVGAPLTLPLTYCTCNALVVLLLVLWCDLLGLKCEGFFSGPASPSHASPVTWMSAP